MQGRIGVCAHVYVFMSGGRVGVVVVGGGGGGGGGLGGGGGDGGGGGGCGGGGGGGGGGGCGGGGGGYSKINLGTEIFSFKLLIICNACVCGRTTERATKALKLYFASEHAICCQQSLCPTEYMKPYYAIYMCVCVYICIYSDDIYIYIYTHTHTHLYHQSSCAGTGVGMG